MPPSNSIDGRRWWVTTKTGVWNGGLVLVPSGVAELPSAPDLGADARIVLLGEGVIDAPGAAGLAGHLVEPPGSDHPFVQHFASVTERSRL